MTVSPRVLKGGIVTVDPVSGAVMRVIALQYNPDTLTRTFQVQASSDGSTDRSEALRLKGPATETYKVDAELDLTDQLEHPGENRAAVEVGLLPQLAALEGLVNPTSATLARNDAMARSGRLEIIPAQAPLTLFVWGRNRIMPVRITELSVTEEAFDPALNPIRAKVSLGMRVLNINDLGFDHRGGNLFMAYLRSKERLATRTSGSLDQLGISGIG
jgi:hypothetical protein